MQDGHSQRTGSYLESSVVRVIHACSFLQKLVFSSSTWLLEGLMTTTAHNIHVEYSASFFQ